MHVLRRWGAWHPEWWLLTISATAWYFLLAPNPWSGPASLAGLCAVCRRSGASLEGLAEWLIMVLAMMLPLTIIPVRATAFGSLWRRRHWAIAAFVTGYVFIWMIAGVPSIYLLTSLRYREATVLHWMAGLGFLTAAAWQSTKLKQRFAAACHQTVPLAPDGWSAHRDCLRFGALQGVNCLGNCGVLMIAAMLSPWHQSMMLVVSAVLLYERYLMRPRSRALLLVLGFLAVGHFAFA